MLSLKPIFEEILFLAYAGLIKLNLKQHQNSFLRKSLSVSCFDLSYHIDKNSFKQSISLENR